MEWGTMADAIIRAGIRTFGETVVYTPQLKAPREIRAIFNAEFQGVDPNIGVGIGSVAPVIDVRLADISETPSPGDRVCIRGDHYRVVEMQPDGQGAARLLLQKL